MLTLCSYDLEDTFDVVVGDPSSSESTRFTLHTNVFVAQSGFLSATRKPEWIAQNPGRPVDLKDEDPELFQAYMNCVYFGFESIEHWADAFEHPPHRATSANDEHNALFTKLISLYLLCERLIDFKAANMVIDEITRFSLNTGVIPLLAPTSLVYNSTAKGSPLRKLLCDYWMYDSGNIDRETLLADDFPVECLQDVALAVLKKFDEFPQNPFIRSDLALSVRTLCLKEKCRYHLHDDKDPQCGVKEQSDGM
jgi:hypothetical protein